MWCVLVFETIFRSLSIIFELHTEYTSCLAHIYLHLCYSVYEFVSRFDLYRRTAYSFGWKSPLDVYVLNTVTDTHTILNVVGSFLFMLSVFSFSHSTGENNIDLECDPCNNVGPASPGYHSVTTRISAFEQCGYTVYNFTAFNIFAFILHVEICFS